MLNSIAPFVSLLNRGNQLHTPPAHSNAFASRAGTNGSINFAENRHQRDSFEIFNAILQRGYNQILFKPGNESSTNLQPTQPELGEYGSAGFQNVERISSQQAADTILNFITSRIQSDAANGASQDELLQRLDQGLQGFIKGFNEAKDQIEALGLLTPDLSDEINNTFERVTAGIEQLRESIIGDVADDEPSEVIGDINRSSNLSRLRLEAQTAESSSFSLSLTTQDGDQVTIDISRASQSSFSANFESDADGSSLSINQQNSSSSSFNLNVTGELDEGELAAIDQLLQDVDAIANDFFGGRLDQAFELALELDINREELSSLNLQLQKTTTSQALAEYQTTAQNNLSSSGVGSSQPVTSPFAELNQLIDFVQDLSDKAGKFAQPTRLIEDLANGVSSIGYQEQNNVVNLGEKLNELISQFEL